MARLQVEISRIEVKGGLGGETREVELVSTVELVYLDQSVRVTRTKGEVG